MEDLKILRAAVEGVDVNRNFPVNFGVKGKITIQTRSFLTYAMSEPESKFWRSCLKT